MKERRRITSSGAKVPFSLGLEIGAKAPTPVAAIYEIAR
jgi:hypothetical protein